MNTAIRLYADSANAKTKIENGFDLTDYDKRTIEFAKEYSEKLLAIDINIDIDSMIDTGWELFNKYFSVAETGIKAELVEKYGKQKSKLQ
jgi:V/A-type H+-transporting ATPase subunit B